jgi:rubrerythrin
MKLIEKLTDRIDEEIEDVKYYAKLATEVKAEYPTLAQVLFNISAQEDGHQAAIHNEVVKIIEEHRRTHGEPPAAMMAVYNYLHKKSIDKLAEARMYQDVYKST